MNKSTKPEKKTKSADEYRRWPEVFHFGHFSAASAGLDHGVGTLRSIQPPFPELKDKTNCVVLMDQVHGTNVEWLTACPNEPVAQTDGLATQQEAMALLVQTADCVPVLLFDPKQRVIAALHVGWRGLVGGMVTQGIQLLQKHQVQPVDLLVGIGPAICQACYEIGDDVKQQLSALPGGATTILRKEDKWTVDLQVEVQHQLMQQGVVPQNIEILRLCTKEHAEVFASWRRDHMKQRFYSYIRLQPLA